MSKPYLVPFKAEHLMSIVDRDNLYYDWPSSIHKEKFPAFTAIYEDTIIACSGITIQWPGCAIAWAVLTKQAIENKRHMVWITQTTQRVLKDLIRGLNLHRVEMSVLEGMSKYEKWARRLGFELEEGGRASFYTPDRQNIKRFEMIIK